MRKEDIFWVAGLLEGEGCFGYESGCPRVTLGMTDLDTVEKFARTIGATTSIQLCVRGRKKLYHRISVNGSRAAGIMQTVFPLMSRRRKQKILDVLAVWRSTRRYSGKGSTDLAA